MSIPKCGRRAHRADPCRGGGPRSTRIFVNAAIKKAMCREAGADRAWLVKVRPWWGHDEHFHVRIACPPDSPQCKPQPPPDAERRLRPRARLLVQARRSCIRRRRRCRPKPQHVMTLAGAAARRAGRSWLRRDCRPYEPVSVTCQPHDEHDQIPCVPNSACCTVAAKSISAAAKTTVAAAKPIATLRRRFHQPRQPITSR